MERLTNLFTKDKLYATCVVLFLIGLPILLVITISNKEESKSVSHTSSVTPAVEAKPAPKPDPINLSGTGQTATEKFELQSGLAVFKMTHTGSRNFGIWLYDSNGERLELLVNDIGNFNGSKAVQIPANGEYLLDVSADGPWTVIIKQ